MAIVDTVGVWYFGCILAKLAGNAWYAAIDNVVRAVGRIVVCVDAAADVSTAMMRILSRLLPSTCEPIAANTSSLLSSSTCGAGEGERRGRDDRVRVPAG